MDRFRAFKNSASFKPHLAWAVGHAQRQMYRDKIHSAKGRTAHTIEWQCLH